MSEDVQKLKQDFIDAKAAEHKMWLRRKELVKDTDAAYHALCEAKEDAQEAMEAHGQFIGICEDCETVILAGEKGYLDDEAHLCEAHAPTVGDWISNLQWQIDNDDIDEFYETKAEAESQLASLKKRDPNESLAYMVG